jgi:hypothetical protein
VVIHEKPAPRKEGEEGGQRPHGERPPRQHNEGGPKHDSGKRRFEADDAEKDSDDGFEQVVDEERKRGEKRVGGRGGRGRGGYHRGSGEDREH